MIPIVSGQTRTCGGIMHKEPNTPSSREREDFIIEDLDLGCEEVIPASGPVSIRSSFKRALTSVDFPTFGRPTNAT